MNKRTFIQSLGLLAIGCLQALGVFWRKPSFGKPSITRIEWVISKEYRGRSAFQYRECFRPYDHGLVLIETPDGDIIDHVFPDEKPYGVNE